MRNSVALNTQTSFKQNVLSVQRSTIDSKRSRINSRPKLISKIGIRYYFHQLKRCLLISYVAFSIYISIIITVGILIVYFSAPQKRVKSCSTTYKVLITDINNQDSTPQYVVIGDVNNDTKLDIVVVTTGTDSVKIFLSKGNGIFFHHITLSMGVTSQPYSAVLGNFNLDRCLDIAVANYGLHNVMIFIGDCQGHFHNYASYSTGPSQPIMIEASDLNNDGWLDLVVTNNGTNSIGVLLGHGDGTFTDPTRYSTAFDSFPHDIAIDDINNDRQYDLIVANYGTDNVGIHLGYGNGSFAPQITLSTGSGSRPYSLVLTDVNQDHKLDIIVANIGIGTITLFLGNGNETFIEKTTLLKNIFGPVQLQIGDLNNDYYKDLVIVSAWNDSVYVLLGYNNGTFDEQFSSSTDFNSQPWSLVLGDVNDDNRTDVVIANHGTNNIGVLLGYEPGVFKNQTKYLTGVNSYPWSAILDDVNNDKILDIIVVYTFSGYLGVWIGYGDGTFATEIVYSTGSDSQSYTLATGDFNEDNQLDIAVANWGTDNIGIFLGYGNGSFQEQKTISTGHDSAPRSIDVGDFNNDKHLDIVIVNEKAENVALLLGFGNGSFATQITFSTGNSSRPMSIVVADFNNDQRMDIAVANYGIGTVGVFLGDGIGNFTNQTMYISDFHPPIFITVGDMNNDNITDLIFATRTDLVETVGLFLGVGDGTFQTSMRYPAHDDSAPYGLSIGDLNDDNYLDIVLANANPDNIGILFGYGDGTFASQQTYSTGTDSFPTMTVLGDLNNDNRLDIVVTNLIDCSIGIFLGYNYGAIERSLIYTTGSSPKPQSIALNDFNHDGQLDLVVANSGRSTIGIHIKSSSELFTNETSYQTGTNSLPSAVIAANFNKDSNVDIAVVNTGNDNIGLFLGRDNGTFEMGRFFSTGIDSQPSAIAAGHLNNDAHMDVVVSNYAANNIGVFVGYNYPSHRLEGLYSMGFNSIPWHISTGDLNNDNHADVVIINLNSATMSILLGYGNGTFATPIMYIIDSALRPIASVIADFNNDNHLDIVVCFHLKGIGVYLGYGNGTMFSPKIYPIEDQSYPRNIYAANFNDDPWMDLVVVADSERDHVIVLLGHGNGTFGNQTNYSTDLNSAKLSVSVGDFNNDHRLDIAITNNEYNSIGIFLGYGNGTFTAQTTYSTGYDSSPSSISVGDLNNDTHLDLVVTNSRPKNIGLFFGYGNGSFADQKTFSVNIGFESRPVSAVINDFNNDNLLDIAIASSFDSKIILFLNYGNGTFKISKVYDTGYQSFPTYIVANDLNHDGALDIIVANGETGTIGVFLGFCCDLFLHQMNFSTGIDSGPHSIVLGDFNTDSILDIAVANLRAENIGVMFGFGDGSFDTQTTYPTGVGSHPYALVVSDCNNDTHLDIFVANYGTETIGVLVGYGNGTFGNYNTYSTGPGSRPNAITVLHFNNDSRLDIAVTNDGANNIVILFGLGNGSFELTRTFLTGYKTRPCAIASEDYNIDNETDIFITECDSNSIGVVSKFC